MDLLYGLMMGGYTRSLPDIPHGGAGSRGVLYLFVMGIEPTTSALTGTLTAELHDYLVISRTVDNVAILGPPMP